MDEWTRIFFSTVYRMSKTIGRRLWRFRLFLSLLSVLLLCLVYVLSSPDSGAKDSSDILDLTSIKNQADQKCIHPSLSLWTPQLRALFATTAAPLNCGTEDDWVFTAGDVLRISPEAVTRHGRIDCEYASILRGSDDFKIDLETEFRTIRDGDRIASDFFEVRCRSASGHSYKNKHAGIAASAATLDRNAQANDKEKRPGRTPLGLDILIFGFDSVSRMMWMRGLPKSHSYFVDVLGGVVLEGYNIVGDGTTQALLPFMTGRTEAELPESRRGFEGAVTLDGFPWLWQELKDVGYVTQFAEDQSDYGTFTYRLLGFRDQPVDHYMRPFHMAVRNDAKRPHCMKGSRPEHVAMMDWMRGFVDVYKDKPKFSFVFDAELTHDTGSKYLSVADEDLLSLLKHLNDSGHLERALLVVMSDHGARFSENRITDQGRLEERNPYVGLRLPPKFAAQHPKILQNLRTNVHRLTTAFDLHATMREVINFTGTDAGELSQRAISLFKEIPKQRTCHDAGIELHWCACLTWTPLSVDDPTVQRSAHEITQHFNNLTAGERDRCAELSLKEVKSVVRFSTSDDVLRFRKSLDLHGRQPDLSDSRQASVSLFLVTLVTTPGDGIFEATATYRPGDETISVDSKSLSRIDRYGKQPHCIMDRFPHLRQFCYCKVQLP